MIKQSVRLSPNRIRYTVISHQTAGLLFLTIIGDSGKGPVYMDCRGASKEDIEYMKYWLLNEGNQGVLDYLSEEGIDPARHAIEFRTYDISLNGGVWFNPEGETSLKGLYAAGQNIPGDVGGGCFRLDGRGKSGPICQGVRYCY